MRVSALYQKSEDVDENLIYDRRRISPLLFYLELSRRDTRSRTFAVTHPEQAKQGQNLKLLGNRKFGRHLTNINKEVIIIFLIRWI